MDEIPAELVINFDPVGLNIVPTSDWTIEAEGSKRVEIIGKDKRQLTAVFNGTLDRDFLPFQIIYQGTHLHAVCLIMTLQETGISHTLLTTSLMRRQ